MDEAELIKVGVAHVAATKLDVFGTATVEMRIAALELSRDAGLPHGLDAFR